MLGPSIYDVCKILGFFDPLPPCPRWATGLYYQINATSLTLSAFPLPPPPLDVDVINGWFHTKSDALRLNEHKQICATEDRDDHNVGLIQLFIVTNASVDNG